MRSIVILLSIVALSGPGFAAGGTLEERTAKDGDWGYRPADGATVALNPPSFTWFPERIPGMYTLEVAKDAAFTEMAYACSATPWSAHAPDVALDPGTYFWRYRITETGGGTTNWSRVRRFEVPEGLVSFPKPALDVLVSRIPGRHPRLFVRPEEVDDLRATAEEAHAGRYAEVIAAADRVLKNPPDTTEPPKYPEGTPHKGEEWKKIWWGNRKRSIAVTEGAANCAFAYLLTGEERYGMMARDLVMAFADWDPKGSTNYRYNDEAAMPLLYWPSRAYTWAYDTFSEADREKLTAVMTVRGGDCFNHLRGRKHLWTPYASHSNRAWHFLGEVATVFHDTIPQAPQWLDYAFTIFYTCYPVWGDSDGGWHEGVGYWASYISRFLWWSMNCQAIYDIDPFDRPFFRETGYYGIYVVPPHAPAGAWGDQGPLSSSQRVSRLMAELAAGARNPHWQWYAEQHSDSAGWGWMGLLNATRMEGVSAQAPKDLATSRAFMGTGTAVLNTTLLDGTQNTQVHFKSSPMGRQSHGYNAHNAFLLYWKGQPVFVRSGRRDIHGSPHHTKWMWDTKSDNAILVNGEGQEKHSALPGGRIVHFSTSDTRDEVTGEAGMAYENLNRWTRRVVFLKPDVLIVHDVLEAPEPSTYQWLLHAKGKFDLLEDGARWSGEVGNVAVDFLTPDGLKLSQTDEYETPPHDWAKFDLGEWHLTAETAEKAARQQFVTVIRVGDADATVVHERANETHTLTVERPGREEEVVVLAP